MCDNERRASFHQMIKSVLQIALGSFNVFGAIRVTDDGRPVKMLNELEIVGNTLYANIWQSALIAVIDLPSGKVVKYLDFTEKGRSIYRNYPNKSAKKPYPPYKA